MLHDFPRRLHRLVPHAPGAILISDAARQLDVTYKTTERHMKQLKARGLVKQVPTGNPRHTAWQVTGKGFFTPPTGARFRTVLVPGVAWPYAVEPAQ